MVAAYGGNATLSPDPVLSGESSASLTKVLREQRLRAFLGNIDSEILILPHVAPQKAL